MANSLDGLKPEYWLPQLQVLLEDKLIAKEIANFEMVDEGDTFHKPYLSDLTSGDYTANQTTGAIATTDVTATDESLVVDTAKYTSFQIDKTDKALIKNDYKVGNEMAKRGAYTLAKTVNQSVLAEYANAGLSVDDGDIGGTPATAITLSVDNYAKVLSVIERKLLEQSDGALEDGDLFGVISPRFFETLQQAGIARQTGLGDKSVVKGWREVELGGFRLYTSNLLTKVSTTRHCLFGKKGSIDVKMSEELNVEKLENTTNSDATKNLNWQYIIWNMFGKKTYTQPGKMLVDVQIAEA